MNELKKIADIIGVFVVAFWLAEKLLICNSHFIQTTKVTQSVNANKLANKLNDNDTLNKIALLTKFKIKSNCSNTKEYQCPGINKCIRQNQRCDGFNDCPDRSDEKNCEWCNRTFNNEENLRLLIQNSQINLANNYTAKIYNCYYKIINLKSNVITGIRLRKFSVGKLNSETKKCENAWIELSESDFDQHLGFTKIVTKRSQAVEKVLIYEKNFTSSSEFVNIPGKFCGYLRNFWSSYYSSKKYILINYFRLIENLNSLKTFNDTFEFEISFYDKDSLNPISFSKQKYQLNSYKQLRNLDYGTELEGSACSHLYSNCSSFDSDGCVLTSPGYPGIYLKNLKCQYFVKNQISSKQNMLNQKLILINDNFQADGTICHFESLLSSGKSSPNQMPNSYFCDSGPRKSSECNDFINIYEGINKFNTQIPMSLVLASKVCGMGRLSKVVSKKNALVLELESGSDGLFANSGFLFYIMNQKQYFDNYELFNKFDKSQIKSQNEYISLKELERLQIEQCNSNMKLCTLVINDDLIQQTYPSKPKQLQEEEQANDYTDDSIKNFNFVETTSSTKVDESKENEEGFKIGHLFNINQYHPDNFTLKYILRTKKHNTIAIYIDKFAPYRGASSSTYNSYATKDNCERNYLKMETTNQLIAQYEDEEEYSEYDDELSDDNEYFTIQPSQSNNQEAQRKEQKSSFSKSFKYDTNEHSKRHLLVKLCDPLSSSETASNPATRFYLINSSKNTRLARRNHRRSSVNKQTNNIDISQRKSTRTNLLITYFSKEKTLSQSSTLFDFKINYEFFNFDWRTYQANTVCDFVYDMNFDASLPLSGKITNPKASIFYKISDEYLKCKYKFIASNNYYIKMTIKSIDFDNNNAKNNKECEENIFFTNVNLTRENGERCKMLDKKLVIRDLSHPWSSISASEEIFDTSYDYDDMSYTEPSKAQLETKLCLCRTRKHMNYVYVSKYDALEVEYIVKLDKNQRDNDNMKLGNNFLISYEFLSRNCNKYSYKSLKSANKGKLIYFHSNYGFQDALLELKNKRLLELNNNDELLGSDLTHSYNSNNLHYNSASNNEMYYQEDDKALREADLLKKILMANLNFYCKFLIKAPKNSFVNLEFSELDLPKNCEKNHLKLYSNYDQHGNETLTDFFKSRPAPFIRLCSPHNIVESTSDFDMSSHQNRSMLVADFFDETLTNSSLNCLNKPTKICFMSNEIKHDFNPISNDGIGRHVGSKEFYNNLVIELMSNDFKQFYFEIKYNFFKILNPYMDDVEKLNINNEISKSDECLFKCNEKSPYTNHSIVICLDTSLVCDNEVDCILTNNDELNCSFQLHAKFILVALCSVFGFTFFILINFCMCKRACKTKKTISISQISSNRRISKNIIYSQTSQSDHLDDSNDDTYN